MWTSSSRCSSAVLHPAAHTASGRCCCNFDNLLFDNLILHNCVSIPQAVGVVATIVMWYAMVYTNMGFNTASGRCCCNSHSNL